MYIKLFQEILYYTDDYKQVLDKNYLWMDTDNVELQSPLPCNANNYIIAALGRYLTSLLLDGNYGAKTFICLSLIFYKNNYILYIIRTLNKNTTMIVLLFLLF